jgi:hypothetical protein
MEPGPRDLQKRALITRPLRQSSNPCSGFISIGWMMLPSIVTYENEEGMISWKAKKWRKQAAFNTTERPVILMRADWSRSMHPELQGTCLVQAWVIQVRTGTRRVQPPHGSSLVVSRSPHASLPTERTRTHRRVPPVTPSIFITSAHFHAQLKIVQSFSTVEILLYSPKP